MGGSRRLERCQARRVTSSGKFHVSGGTHLKGLLQGIHGALHHHADATGRTSELWGYIPLVLTEGLTVLLDVTIPRPVWMGPVKGVLANEECEFEVSELVQTWLSKRFEESPEVAKVVLDFVIGRYIARG
ncbi:hypothetical protein F0U59_28500 [Archangium gephyra]|nr:hypothetical protein F0U59_28500 [Archangium gephyra]